MGEEVLRHLPVALEVLLPAVEGRVGDEDQRVRPFQDQAPRGGVHGLAGHGEDLQPQVESAKTGSPQGEEIEEELDKLDELIDDALDEDEEEAEKQAQEFVDQYKQEGGQ